jgi:hypothetical protein
LFLLFFAGHENLALFFTPVYVLIKERTFQCQYLFFD